ncbi:hypothetical protein F5883DRAFT_382976, partial [Diaporthe sp. PMI_573]
LYDILPDIFRIEGVTPYDTSKILKERGKFQYQTIKKMVPAVNFDYNYGLWLDSEAIAIRPFSLREIFNTYIRAPTIWRSRMAKTDFMKAMMRDCANVLGRSIDSFSSILWTFESTQWIIEKEIIFDMIEYIEHAHQRDFWSVWADNNGPFEINLYNLYIIARKLETVD